MAIHRKILRWLENELFEGNIQLGQDLPSDSEIARAIGVGRSRECRSAPAHVQLALPDS